MPRERDQGKGPRAKEWGEGENQMVPRSLQEGSHETCPGPLTPRTKKNKSVQLQSTSFIVI